MIRELRNLRSPGAASQPKSFLAGLVILTLSLGTLYSMARGVQLAYQDEKDYVQLAQNLVTYHKYTFDGSTPTTFRPPGYPILLALLMQIGLGKVVYLRIANFIAFVLCLVLIYLILKNQATQRAATAGTVMVLCYPVLFYTAGTLYPQTVGASLFLAAIYLLTKERVSSTAMALAGFLTGYLILMIPVLLFVLPVFTLWLWLVRSVKFGRVLIAFVATALLPLVLWTARNFIVSKSLIPISSNYGYALLVGNSEKTNVQRAVMIDLSHYQARVVAKPEAEQASYFYKGAFEFIKRNKGSAAKLYFLKLLNHFNYTNKLATASERAWWKDIVMISTYYPLLGFCIIRFLVFRRFRITPFEGLTATLYLLSAMVYAVFLTRIRFRLPFDYLLVMICALFLDRLSDKYLKRGRLHHDA